MAVEGESAIELDLVKLEIDGYNEGEVELNGSDG